MNYEVKIGQFKGPFDLILYFIERDEINIYDIPISRLLDDFLAHIKELETLDIEVASEFILVAATLMRIKVRMLLPRKEVDEKGVEIDPRQELVDKIIEYKKFKEVVEELRTLEEEHSMRVRRGNTTQESYNIANNFSTEMDLESINLFKLLKTFNRVMDRLKDKEKEQPRHTVVKLPYSMDEQKEYLMELLQLGEPLSFERLFETCRDRYEAIYRFLSILDLVQSKLVFISIGEGANNFWINSGQEAHPQIDLVSEEG